MSGGSGRTWHQQAGVGSWVPEEKHRLLYKYLDGTRNMWREWPKRTYIDPFCGPGRVQVKGESFTRDGGALVAWRVLAAAAPFTQVLIGDIDESRVAACEQRLKALGAPVKAFKGPAVETVRRMVTETPAGSLTLAYIDPYSLELLDFSIFQALAERRVDIIVNFSTMDLQRNVEVELDPDRARFDGPAPGWRNLADVQSTNKQGMQRALFEHWRKLVSSLGFTHSEEMPLIPNDRGSGIYRMLLFSKHPSPRRVWGDVARGPNRSFDFEA
jgi:three-Cys-motif partner protein